MNKGRLLANSALVALLLAVGTSLAAAGSDREPYCSDTTCSTCVYIDIFDGAHKTNAPAGSPWVLPNRNNGRGVSVGRLLKGQTYLVTVTGWVSYWFKGWWEYYPTVGIPAQPPKYYSTGTGAPSTTRQTQTGYDWMCLFAYPQCPGTPSSMNLPATYPSSRLSLDGGQTYTDMMQILGAGCSPDHTYRFLIAGKGEEGFFRISDTGPTFDNYGKYKICVRAVCCDSEDDCKDLAPAEANASPSFSIDGVFDPRLMGGSADR